MAFVVGENGVQAIRDFIKPFDITSVVTNRSSISTLWSGDKTALLMGHTSMRYSWDFSAANLTNALYYNFWKITEYSGSDTFVLSKTATDTYEGLRITSDSAAYHYVVKKNSSTSCTVWVKGIILSGDTLNSKEIADTGYELISTFSLSGDATTLFSKFMSQKSFVFTKTVSGAFSLTKNNDIMFFTVPLDTSATSVGFIPMHFSGATTNTSGTTISTYWTGDTWFFSRHQKWQMVNSSSANTKTLIIINTQDIGIQTLSAADYAALGSSADPNVLYFIPEN